MKSYPIIDMSPRYGTPVYAFDKLDGSNVRAEWSRKKGFWKFGRRHGLLDDSNPFLQEAPDIIKRDFEDALGKIFVDRRWQKVVAFFEFWGPGSFAGLHEQEPHRCTLIDVAADKRGLLEPREFLRTFAGVYHAPLLYQGNFNHELEEQVRSGQLPGMTFEGIVCKGGYTSPGLPLMFKVKNQAWYEKLRARCAGDEALFEKLK